MGTSMARASRSWITAHVGANLIWDLNEHRALHDVIARAPLELIFYGRTVTTDSISLLLRGTSGTLALLALLPRNTDFL